MKRENLNEKIKDIPLPDRMRRLALDERGFPIPRFVPFIEGKPEFRGMDGEHLATCVRARRCWLCAQPLGQHMTFVIGPMCAVNRVSSEPPSHHSCAEYAAKACPFLTQPRAKRNEKDMPEGSVAGVGLKRNPGVVLLWTTGSYKIFRPPGGGVLFTVGEPERVEFFCAGRTATRSEIMDSIESGLPLLRGPAEQEGREAVAELEKMIAVAMKLVPA